MPTDQRFRLDDDQGVPPVEEAGEGEQGQSSRVCKPPRLDLPLLTEGQLLTQEQDFCAQGRARTNRRLQKIPDIEGQIAAYGDSP